MLFVQHTNHLAVAEACREFWKTRLGKNLVTEEKSPESYALGEYELVSAHNGYVRIISSHDWPVEQSESLAQYLSQTFTNLVVEWRSESFADTYHFGVFEQGSRKFHAQMEIKGKSDNADEVVTTEGNDYAIANGFKPGEEGFKNFNGLDADRITRRLGLNFGDENEAVTVDGILLKETGTAAK